MSKVTVYKFVGYDFENDTPTTSRRWAMMEFIKRGNFGIAAGTAIEVPASILDIDGLTPHGYNPDSVIGSGGFQRRVR